MAADLKLLSFDDIVAADDLKTEKVEVPEWGGSVMLTALTAEERDEYEADVTRTKGQNVEVNFKNLRAKLVAKCITDGNGGRPFNNPKGVDALGKKSAAVLVRLFDRARHLSKMTQDDVEELAKN